MADITHEPDLGMRRCSCGGIPQRLQIQISLKNVKLYGFVCVKCGKRSQPAAYPMVAKKNWNRMVNNDGIDQQG